MTTIHGSVGQRAGVDPLPEDEAGRLSISRRDPMNATDKGSGLPRNSLDTARPVRFTA
jgi:hypothetical protein